MSELNKEPDAVGNGKDAADESRRDFLRKSVYAAYATPVIMSMLVGKNSGQGSGCSGQGPGGGKNRYGDDPE